MKKINNNNDKLVQSAQHEAHFPIVGIGASAGGLAALEAFFSGMPANIDPNMAFVVVQHLAPDHESILTNLIRRYTRMQVFEVIDGMKVQINCAYIIPPGFDMAFLNGTLQLLEPAYPPGQRLPIDFFFRSLAQDQRDRSIAIVLSGTGSDGSQGIQSIKHESGIVIVQTPESAEYDGMPKSAISTGLVDIELPPSSMAPYLVNYSTRISENQLKSITTPQNANYIKKIFILLRNHTGHDFSEYKNNTIIRRIERRMAVQQIDNIAEYVRYLQNQNSEVDGLFRDLLIGVTNFFRDPEAFDALEQKIIPKLFENKADDSTIRVWSPGCSSGEEAYSIAILLSEYMESLNKKYNLQVFATDIDSQAIAKAREGIFPASISEDISTERLNRFFTIVHTDKKGRPLSYRINKSIREILIFSEQNIIKDPPFSKLDLISCRNLMIYLNGELQKKIIPLFHYALRSNGMLFLGSSETIGEFTDLFSIIDRKARLYLSISNSIRSRSLGIRDFIQPTQKERTTSFRKEWNKPSINKDPLREIAEKTLLKKLAPASALVNKSGDIFYLQGRTGMYLEPAAGVTGTPNIHKMAREGLKHELISALLKAVQTQESVKCFGLMVKTNDHFTPVDLSICPAEKASKETDLPDLYLVILKDGQAQKTIPSSNHTSTTDTEKEALISSLKHDLSSQKEYLENLNEELETSNEELRYSNEELQSVNEELQSTNEELDTSKEELQSVNEELTTVNTELQTKVQDLSTLNNDMNNLLSGTGIATIFVDFQMSILRFTPTVSEIINVISSDIGRPIYHFINNLVNYETLSADIQSVLDNLTPKEIEVMTKSGMSYSMRILPYRTVDNVIEGAVISFIDITETKKAADIIEKQNSIVNALLENLQIGVYMVDSITGKPLIANDTCLKLLGYDILPEVESENFSKFFNLRKADTNEPYPNDKIPLIEAINGDSKHVDDIIIISPNGDQKNLEMFGTPIKDSNGTVWAGLISFQDITERKLMEQELITLLKDKELILKEVNHRVKNNMRSINSLLSLQSQRMNNPECVSALTEASNRLKSMELLYDKLFQSPNFSELSVKTYVTSLVDSVFSILPLNKSIKIIKHIDDFVLDVKRLQPIGIIINELLTNILKYAFTEQHDGTVTVSVKLVSDRVTLFVQDNGIGIQESIDFENSGGFGLTLVNMLTKQIGGEITLKRQKGTKIIIKFDL